MDSKGFYSILGLQPGATIQEVKKAYQKKQIELHPSGRERQKLRSTPEYMAMTDDQKAAKESELDQKVAEINEAYKVLSDEGKKQQYDSGAGEFSEFGAGEFSEFGAAGFSGFNDINDIFSQFASGGRRRKQEYKVKDIVTDIKITCKDVFLGKTSKYRIKCTKICAGCNGKGGKNFDKCGKCKGNGKVVIKMQIMGFMGSNAVTDCPDCEGKGVKLSNPKCSDCKGEAVLQDAKIVEVEIKPGVQNGDKICYKGQGNQYPGYQTGDVVFNIIVSDNDGYQRIGDDFICYIDIDILTVLAGGVVYFEHVDGRKLAIKVDPFKNLESAICIPNEGFKNARTGRRGELYLKPKVLINSNLDRAKLSEYLKPLMSKPSGQYANAHSTLFKLPQAPQNETYEEEGSSRERFFQGGFTISDFF